MNHPPVVFYFRATVDVSVVRMQMQTEIIETREISHQLSRYWNIWRWFDNCALWDLSFFSLAERQTSCHSPWQFMRNSIMSSELMRMLNVIKTGWLMNVIFWEFGTSSKNIWRPSWKFEMFYVYSWCLWVILTQTFPSNRSSPGQRGFRGSHVPARDLRGMLWRYVLHPSMHSSVLTRHS